MITVKLRCTANVARTEEVSSSFKILTAKLTRKSLLESSMSE